MKSFAFLAAAVLAIAAVTPASASSCSSWKSTCESRGGGAYCQSQFAKCMKSGAWTEGAKFGGTTHTGLTKK